MTQRPRWTDAEDAATILRRSRHDYGTLLLVARLPLVPAKTIQQLDGLRDPASIYRRLNPLTQAGLIGNIQPPLGRGHTPRLFYLTDLGVAAIARVQGVEPRRVALQFRTRRSDLLASLPGVPHLMATYALLGEVAAALPGRPNLLVWERPWRRRYDRPTAKARVGVTLPAYAAVSWGEEASGFLLLPDLGNLALRPFRAKLDHLLVLRNLDGAPFPLLVVGTSDEARAGAWRRLLQEVAQWRGEALLDALVICRHHPEADLATLSTLISARLTSRDRLVQRKQAAPLRVRRRAAAMVPQVVGSGPVALSRSTDASNRTSPGPAAGDLKLLDLVARHPFLAPADLCEVLNWKLRSVRERLDRLTHFGLIRFLGGPEVDEKTAAGELVEATFSGLSLVAACQGVALAQAARHSGLAGGGPERPTGARTRLLRELLHTRGADGIFVSFARLARRLADGRDDGLLEWRNARACSRGPFRPDGYGIYRHRGRSYGFFLEYDRNTEDFKDLINKLDAYYEYRASERMEREYDAFPTVLVVTADYGPEQRIAAALRTAAVGRAPRLPVLLTTTDKLGKEPDGVLGPVWRDEMSLARCCWPGEEVFGMRPP